MNRAALIFAGAFVVIAAIYYSFVGFGEVITNASSEEYASGDLGIAFEYPSTYTIGEHDLGNGERAHRDIVLIAKKDLPPPQNGEGPPAITIEVFQNNIENYTADSVIRSTNFTNYKLSPDGVVALTTVGDQDGLGFKWSGLYEGRSIVVAQPDWVYVFSVTYLAHEDALIEDFERILTTVRFK